MPNESHKTTLEYAESLCSSPDWEVLVVKIRPRKMNLIEKISDLLTYKVRADQCMLPCQRVPVYVSRSFLLRVLDLDQETVLNIPLKYLGSCQVHYQEINMFYSAGEHNDEIDIGTCVGGCHNARTAAHGSNKRVSH